MWPQTLAIPGFLSGLIFSGVLSMTEGRWRFEDLSLPRVGAWGAVAGALIILVGVLIGLRLQVARSSTSNLDADHAKEADLSWSTASSEAVTNLKQQSGNRPH